MRIIIFGTGLFYERRKKMLPANTKIEAFLDNNVTKQGLILDSIRIYNPNNIFKLEYDAIVLASLTPGDMRKQLIDLGVKDEFIYYWEEFISINSHGILTKYEAESVISINDRKVLIIVPILNYAGGFLAALNAGLVLKNEGMHVVIVSPVYHEKVIEDVMRNGISVWICPALPYVSDVELQWIYEFDYVISNSLQTIICATKIKKGRNLIFWIHEHSGQYDEILQQYIKYCDLRYLNEINVVAVSKLCRRIFCQHFPDIDVKVMPLDIKEFDCVKTKKSKIIIALIGSIYPLKNQIGFVNAISKLPKECKQKIECVLIGRVINKKYEDKLRKQIKDLPYIRFIGELPFEAVQKMYETIDIVVCASKEETMSMTIIEGLMCGKICITNRKTGISEYLQDGRNGFIYDEENGRCLTKKMEYIISNIEKLDSVKIKARQTYERFFAQKCLENNLKKFMTIGKQK